MPIARAGRDEAAISRRPARLLGWRVCSQHATARVSSRSASAAFAAASPRGRSSPSPWPDVVVPPRQAWPRSSSEPPRLFSSYPGPSLASFSGASTRFASSSAGACPHPRRPRPPRRGRGCGCAGACSAPGPGGVALSWKCGTPRSAGRAIAAPSRLALPGRRAHTRKRSLAALFVWEENTHNTLTPLFCQIHVRELRPTNPTTKTSAVLPSGPCYSRPQARRPPHPTGRPRPRSLRRRRRPRWPVRVGHHVRRAWLRVEGHGSRGQAYRAAAAAALAHLRHFANDALADQLVLAHEPARCKSGQTLADGDAKSQDERPKTSSRVGSRRPAEPQRILPFSCMAARARGRLRATVAHVHVAAGVHQKPHNRIKVPGHRRTQRARPISSASKSVSRPTRN